MNRLNIHERGREIKLEAGKYKIYILGGWYVRHGKFTITLIEKGGTSTVVSKKAVWRSQEFIEGQFAKRAFTVHIPKEGTYKVAFSEHETLKVKTINLPIWSWFFNSLPTKGLEIYIMPNSYLPVW